MNLGIVNNLLKWISRQSIILQLYPLIFFFLIFTGGVVAYLEVQEQKFLIFKEVEQEGVIYVLGLQREFLNHDYKGKGEEEIITSLQENLAKSLKHSSLTNFEISHLFLLDKKMRVIATRDEGHLLTEHNDENIRNVIASGKVYIGNLEEEYADKVHNTSASVAEIIAPLYIEHEIFGAIELEMDVTATMQLIQENYLNVFIKDTIILLLASAILFLLIYYLIRVVVVLRLENVEDRMRELANSSLDFKESNSERNEITALSQIFDRMEIELKEQMVALAEKTEMERELKIASEIQKKLLPDSSPVIQGYELFGVNVSSTDVGGDYYDFIPLGKDRWGIAIGDVSGHGVGAALLMASARSSLRGLAVSGLEETDVLMKDLNDLFVQDVQPGNFMTIVYGIFDFQTGSYFYTNAGHSLPLIYNPEKDEFRELVSHGTMIGLFDDSVYESGSCSLAKGELLIFYTDGIVEQPSDNGEETNYYSLESFQEVIRNSKGSSLKDLAHKIQEEVYRFAGKRTLDDDMTLVLIRREC